MDKKHKVVIQKWEDGILNTSEHLFETADEAIDFTKNKSFHTVKVYEGSVLVHESTRERNKNKS